MPPSNSTPVSIQILQTLQRMERNSSNRSGRDSPGSSILGTLQTAGAAAGGLAAGAVASAPISGGTLAAQGQLLLQAIGSDQAVVSKVLALASSLNQLRNAWDGAGAASKNYAVNSVIGMSAIGAAARYAPGAIEGLGKASRFLGNMSIGSSLAMGAGVYGAGIASEEILGRNLASSSLRVAGVSQIALAGNRALTRGVTSRVAAGMMTRSAGFTSLALGRIGLAGLVAAEVYNALPTGEAGTETRDQVAARGGNAEVYQSLHTANTSNFITAWQNRASAVGSNEALIDAGIRSGVVRGGGGLWNRIVRGYDLMRPHSVEETNRLVDAASDLSVGNGGASRTDIRAQTRRRDELTLALGFQSRQMDIGDLHGQVQQEAVKTETQQQSMNYLAQELRNAVEELRRLRGPGSPPSSN